MDNISYDNTIGLLARIMRNAQALHNADTSYEFDINSNKPSNCNNMVLNQNPV